MLRDFKMREGADSVLYIFHKILTVSPLYVNSKASGLDLSRLKTNFYSSENLNMNV